MARQFFESFNQKQIEGYREETGIDISNIESLRTDQSSFELRTNQAENSATTPQIFTADHNISLKRLLINDEKVIGAINAGFFYLIDEGTQTPINPTYNLCIRQHSIVGLPASDCPLLYTSGNHFEARQAYYFRSQETVEWAYHLDPGQSSRLAVKDKDDTIATFGNRHYIRWPKKQDHPFLWSPSNGRRVPSAIVLRKH